MKQIQGITKDAKQLHTIQLDDGSEFSISIEYKEMQYGWFITELIHEDFILRGIQVTNNPNILRQFKNRIPFGLACFSKDDRDPYFIEDLNEQHSKLYILSETEVEAYEEFLIV
jgi:hypothetical protein